MGDTDTEETVRRPAGDRDGVIRAVIEGTTDAVFVKDLGGRYLLVNSACARFIGRPAAEIVGRLDTDLYPPDTARQFMEADREVLASGETRVFEGVAEGAHERADYRVTKGVVRDAAGRTVGLFGISHDITDRRAAEEERARRIREQAAREEAEASGRAKDHLLRALRESEERYRAFIANSSEGIWRFEFERPVAVSLPEDEQIDLFYAHCYLAECNDAAARMYGFERGEEMTGARLADFLVRDDPANVEYLRAFIRSGYKLSDAESVEVDREGRTRYFLNSLAGSVEGGRLVRVWGTQRDVTERRRAEDALREGEERLRLALNAGQVGTWDWDVASNRVTWSERVYEFHGRRPGEFGGRVEDFAGMVHPEDRPRVEEAIERALRTGEPYTAEMRVVHPDGQVRWVFTHGQVIFEGGRPVRMLGATVDVTERRGAEEKLRTLVNASESLLGSPRTEAVLSATLKLAGRLVRADAYAIWRFSEGARRWEVVSAEGLSDEYRENWIGVNSDTPSMPESPVVVEDVDALPLLASRRYTSRREGVRSMMALPLKVHGQVAGTLVFYYREPRRFSETDVTVATAIANLSASAIGTAELYEEQSRLRREAEEASRRAAFLAEAASVLTSSLDYERTLQAVARLAVPHVADWCAVDIVGDDGVVRRLAVAHVDPAKVEWAHELAGRYPYDPQAPTGVPNVIRTGRAEVYAEITDEMLAAAAQDEEHLRILRGIGFTSAMAVPMAAHGRVSGVITFVTDKSGRRYGPEDLAFAEHLARRSALAVENARLYREAQEANRIKDEFLATLSHELRTPLTAILGWASMLRTNRFDEAATRRAVETIERNARAQRQIVEDVLDVSRIITGRLRIDARPVEVRSLVEAAVDGVRPAAEAKGVFLSTMLGRDVGVISADPDRLQQVMWNLLSNAVKFTPAGGRVEVELRRVEQQAVVSVRDTGQGIAPEFLPHVFDRFRQADQSTTRRHGGLGLGLAIVRHLVELHGGTVTAASEGEGRGSSFTVRLPLQAVAQPAARFEGAAVSKPFGAEPEGRAPTLAGTRVLLVEDDEDARALLRSILEGRGARVTAVASAAEAWAALEGAAHDVLVSDIGMPEEDGYSLVRRLREREARDGGKLPAVALTAYARDEDRTRALVTGFHAHVAKPVNPAELVAVVASLAALASGRADVS
jgi:PAS domain S-box-containing protein